MFCFDFVAGRVFKKLVDRCQDCCLRGLNSFTEASLSSVVYKRETYDTLLNCWVVTKAEMILNYCEKS